MALNKTVSPSQAQWESGGRTVIDLVVGYVLAWLTSMIVKKAADTGVAWSEAEVFAVVMGFWTAVSAVVKRRLWPTITDAANTGRTDLPATPPAPLP